MTKRAEVDENEPDPWGFGTIAELREDAPKPNKKRMPFIGFYENKETMPYMTNGKRDYKKEGVWDRNHPGREEDRAERHKARRLTDKAGLTHKGDGKDVDHKKALSKGGSGDKSNLRVVSASENRSFSRNKDGSMKSQTSKREAAKRK